MAWLTSEANLVALADLPGSWIERMNGRTPPPTIVLDQDGKAIELDRRETWTQ